MLVILQFGRGPAGHKSYIITSFGIKIAANTEMTTFVGVNIVTWAFDVLP